MSLPKSVEDVIEREIEQRKENCEFRLIRRKGATEPKGPTFDLLPDSLSSTELLKFWADFHGQFNFPDFSVFYSKRNFCMRFTGPDTNIIQSFPDGEDCFVSLLADRRFLFLEDNEHGNTPEYPPMSEIVHNPKRYLTLAQPSEELSASQKANIKLCENAIIVLKQGFIPTYAHKRAYEELKRNSEEIQAALRQRNEFIERSSSSLKDGVPQFQTFTIPILKPDEKPTETDKILGKLFCDFLDAAAHKAYVKKYSELLDGALENSLAAIMCVNRHLEKHPNASVCHALVFWQLFTKETVKLATGKLKEFKFRIAVPRSGLQLTRQTQAITYRKINCQIMLFDYLLKILPPKGGDTETEIAYAKFQFHVFSRYNRYSHFRVKDTNNFTQFDFDLIPNSKDSTDFLGGIIRYHMLRCISNDVRWLTPGLPNNRSTTSSILATYLLQDSTRFPKSNRLVNRINAFLSDKAKSDELVNSYLHLGGNQSELIELLERCCNDNNLMFEEDIPSSDMEISDDRMKLLCSRLVLEYVLKERALLEVRQNLSHTAQALWEHLLITDYESFDLDVEV